jgi:hypothetical protein
MAGHRLLLACLIQEAEFQKVFCPALVDMSVAWYYYLTPVNRLHSLTYSFHAGIASAISLVPPTPSQAPTPAQGESTAMQRAPSWRTPGESAADVMGVTPDVAPFLGTLVDPPSLMYALQGPNVGLSAEQAAAAVLGVGLTGCPGAGWSLMEGHMRHAHGAGSHGHHSSHGSTGARPSPVPSPLTVGSGDRQLSEAGEVGGVRGPQGLHALVASCRHLALWSGLFVARLTASTLALRAPGTLGLGPLMAWASPQATLV